MSSVLPDQDASVVAYLGDQGGSGTRPFILISIGCQINNSFIEGTYGFSSYDGTTNGVGGRPWISAWPHTV
jgi:hypothetical protein